MNISDIRIRKVMQDGRLKAVVSMTVDNAIAVHDIKIVQGDKRFLWQCRAAVMKREYSAI